MSNFIPIEIVTIDDRDPPRINNKIKSLMKNNSKHFEQMQDTLRTSIKISKQKYYFKHSRKPAVNKSIPNVTSPY